MVVTLDKPITESLESWDKRESSPFELHPSPTARGGADRHGPRFGEHVEILAHRAEVERFELGADRIADLPDRARAVDKIDELVRNVFRIRQARDR